MDLDNGVTAHSGKKLPEWITQALLALKPPEKLTVSEWADKYRVLPFGTTDQPGRWNTSRTPYLKGIMDAFTDSDIEEIVFVKPTQVGGTECILNILGYIIDQDPSSTLLVYPSENLAEDISKNRIQPMIRATKVLNDQWQEDKGKLLALQFSKMYLPLSGANSPANLASKPVRFLLMDEVDKYPPRAGREADPISLARERTNRFSYNKKIFTTSTPTLKSGAIWKEFESCTRRLFFYVPCPHCAEFQRLKWSQVKYDNGLKTKEEKRDSAYYECEFCKGIIRDSHKMSMLREGRWQAETSGGKKKVGFSLNAIYAPNLTFGDVAYKWIDAQGDPEKMQNFINSWLGEPWEQVGATAQEASVYAHQSRYTRGIVPEETQIITAGVDVQKNGLYYTIRAWGQGKVSWNIDHGYLMGLDFTSLLEILDRTYYNENGEGYCIGFALVDSGDQTDLVYDFCYVNQPLTLPVKGSSTSINSRFRRSTIDKECTAKGMNLILCDGGYYKDLIFRQLNQSKDSKWFVYDGIDEEYCKQITAEHKVFERKNGNERLLWKKKTSDADNHYLDCEVYAACAADLMGALDLLEEELEEEETTPLAYIPEETKDREDNYWND